MPIWDDPRGPRYESERDRWRREAMRRERSGPEGRERRSFDEEPRGRAERWPWTGRDREDRGMEPWRRDRYAQRHDQERASRGRYEDAGEAAYARRRDAEEAGDMSPVHGGEPYAYGGQEYGLEGHPDLGPGAETGPGWGFQRSDRRDERWRNFDWDDPGVSTSQAGYAAQARSHPGDEHPHAHDEFEADYVRWRDEQLRAHDRDYQDWRREQHQQYDEQYRQFRSERQRHFGEAFHEWRSQRSAVGGIPDTSIGSVGQGQGGYGDKTGVPAGEVDHSPEFGKEPSQVQAASEGQIRGPRHDEGREDEAMRPDEDARRH